MVPTGYLSDINPVCLKLFKNNVADLLNNITFQNALTVFDFALVDKTVRSMSSCLCFLIFESILGINQMPPLVQSFNSSVSDFLLSTKIPLQRRFN